MVAAKCGFMSQCVLVAVLAVASCRQITVYDDHHSDGPRSTQDYSDFVGDDGPIGDSEDDAKASSGFAQPLDFSSFFSSGFGSSASAPGGGEEGNFFQPASSEVKPFTLPLSAAGSPFQDQLQGSASNNNGTGFTSPAVRFQSFFDATGSEAGFRAQDFLGKAENRAPDGETSANAPADFFIGTGFGLDDEGHSGGFGYSPDSSEDDRSSEYRSLVKTPSGVKSSKQTSLPGKSSYPSVRGYPSEGQSTPSRPSQKNPVSYRTGSSQGTPKSPSFSQYKTSEPSHATPYDAYPSKSTASYNPSGPYLSKLSYRPNDKPVPSRAYPSYGHEAKSGYPKKATEFYPTKVGARYTAASTNQDYSSPNYETARAFDAEHYIPDASSPYSPSEYGKDAESYQEAPQEEGLVEEVKITVSADNKNCRKIEKKMSKDNTMTCYVCEDPNTGGNIERCSYESDPTAKSQSYFHGHADTYSSDKGKTPTSYRYRRGLPGRYQGSGYNAYPGDKARSARQQKSDDGDNYRTNYDEYIAKFSEPSESQYRYVPERYTQAADVDYQPQPQDAGNKKDCQTVVKGTMTCSVCQNPKTGGNSEQCSYATNPDENNYFVARQSSFNTKNKPYRKEISSQRSTQPKSGEGGEESGASSSKVPYETSTESAYIVTRKGEHKGPLEVKEHEVIDRSSNQDSDRRSDANVKEKNYDDYFKELFPEVVAARRADSRKAESHDNDDDDSDGYTGSASDAYKVDRSVDEFDDSHRKNNGPKSLSYRPSNGNIGSVEDFGAGDKNSGKGYQPHSTYPESPKKRQSPPRVPAYGNKPVADFDEYNQEYVQQSPTNRGAEQRTHEALRSNARSDNQGDNEGYYKSTLPDYFADTEPKRDLEQVLGEFSQKDRSACKKVIRDKMTCYQCVDKQGMQHEECMFVAASEPKSQHLAYHEVKEFRIQPGSTQDPGKTDSDTDQTRTPDSTSNLKPIVVVDSTGSQSVDVSKTLPEVAAVLTEAKRPATPRKPVKPETRRSRVVTVARETNKSKPTVESKRKAFFKKATTTTTAKPEVKRVVRVFKRPVKASEDGVASATEGRAVATSSADKRETIKVGRKILGLAEDAEAERSEQENEEKVRLSGKERQERRRGKKERQAAERARLEEEQEGVTEFFVHPHDLYPAKTERLYDPVLKVSLPAFMVERSEHEEIFDEVLASGI